MRRVITLTTDFGHRDHYVAAVKGAILSVNPEVSVVDISHDIPAQGIEQAAFVLGCAFPYFPAGTIHVVVVDPAVGTTRRALALATAGYVFIGPDNGVLSVALPDAAREAAGDRSNPVPVPEGVRAFELAESRFHRGDVSPTFHARDIFGPIAAHVSLGVALSKLGPEVTEIVALPPFRAVAEGGAMIGRIVHIDHFGNAITTIRGDQLPADRVRILIGRHEITGPARTYADAAGPSALIGSCGFVEIAVSGGSAEQELGVVIGDSVTVRPG